MHTPLPGPADAYAADAIAKREAEITGKPQRVEPMRADELNDAERAVITRMRTSIGLATAEVPEYCLTMLKSPEMLRCQMEMGTAIFQSAVPARERELIVLRVGWLLRAPYEWGEHVRIGKRYGVTDAEIERIIEGSASGDWSEHDAAILRATEELLTEQAISDDSWNRLALRWDERQLVEFTMIVGQYTATAMVLNALRMRLQAGNTGLSQR